MRIAVAGGTGLVGRGLIRRLLAEEHQVVLFTRDPGKAEHLWGKRCHRLQVTAYTPTRPGPWQGTIAGCQAVVNLAGEPLLDGPWGGRWDAGRRAAILHSRVLTTRHLVQAIRASGDPPSVLLNASAIGYYGTSETVVFTEASPPGRDFLARVCQAWEAEAQTVAASGTRLVILRLGIVLAADSPLLQWLAPLKSFTGGMLGSGRQWLSWVHRDDLINLIMAALTCPDIAGVLNATAPHAVRLAELCATLSRLLGSGPRVGRSGLRVPAALVRAVLGDAAQVVLEGQQVIPQRALACGFRFQYPTIDRALAEILQR